ncbi:MAG: type II toxin-antitoxin system RelE/ParE family toxin [Planctomycetes bacterium]|nr:type II toxin-antitoxin system RelE/ParE family toxin [Planctomycetota bacterium]
MVDDLVPTSCYQTSSGRCPFKDWFDALDRHIQQVFDARLTRIRRGLFGQAENLSRGVWELKFDVGPGFRIYYGRAGGPIVILLHAGHRKRQAGDIDVAREYWADYVRRTRR